MSDPVTLERLTPLPISLLGAENGGAYVVLVDGCWEIAAYRDGVFYLTDAQCGGTYSFEPEWFLPIDLSVDI